MAEDSPFEEVYVSPAEALAFLELYYGTLDITTVDDNELKKAIITATNNIDMLGTFVGRRSTAGQILKLPRIGMFYDGHEVDSTVVPRQVKIATAVYAYKLLNGVKSNSDERLLSKIKVGNLELDYVDDTNMNSTDNHTIPDSVRQLLNGFVSFDTLSFDVVR